jgi:two-component system, OmpR family, phosphate regulon sensor histidine kinase PhoR
MHDAHIQSLDAISDASGAKRCLSLRVRVALIGMGLFLTIACLGFLAVTGYFVQPLLPWIAAVASCAVAGLIWIREAGTLDCVESELHRMALEGPTWKDARKIVDANPLATAWNHLLDRAAQLPTSDKTRSVAALDDEAITLARAMRDLPSAWLITDRDGNIRNAGTAAAALFAVADRRALMGKDLLELLQLRESQPTAGQASNDSDNLEEASQRRTALTRLLSSVRMLNIRRNAIIAERTLNLRISRNRMVGRSGDGEGMIWIIEDITQQTLATKSRDQFLMTATHELRTPLGNLMAYAETLANAEDIDVEQQKEFCNILHAEAGRLSRLVDHLLSVGQMEVGSLVIAHADVDLALVISDAIDNLRAQAESKNHSVESEISPKLPPVRGDRDKLSAVVVNLLGNAIKYTPDGGSIQVRATADEQFIRVEVRDNGLGIAEHEIPRIFDQFFRGNNPDVVAETGNGLGLSFAREVARLHQGEIDVQSRLGEGSIFTLRLPVGGEAKSGLRI